MAFSYCDKGRYAITSEKLNLKFYSPNTFHYFLLTENDEMPINLYEHFFMEKNMYGYICNSKYI